MLKLEEDRNRMQEICKKEEREFCIRLDRCKIARNELRCIMYAFMNKNNNKNNNTHYVRCTHFVTGFRRKDKGEVRVTLQCRRLYTVLVYHIYTYTIRMYIYPIIYNIIVSFIIIIIFTGIINYSLRYET